MKRIPLQPISNLYLADDQIIIEYLMYAKDKRFTRHFDDSNNFHIVFVDQGAEQQPRMVYAILSLIDHVFSEVTNSDATKTCVDMVFDIETNTVMYTARIVDYMS